MKNYDVIIVGGGPAGSTAGYLLSKSGLRVLIIDKSTFPRNKLCAGLITYKTVKLMERVFGETVESLKEKDLINYESDYYEVYYGDKLIAHRNVAVPFRFIERESYDHFLLKKARDAGTDLIEGEGIGLRSLDILKSSVTTLSGKTYSADIIIGADGANSRIRRSFFVDLFGREDWSENLAAAHEIFLSRDSVRKKFEHPVIFFDCVDCGYAWIFPNRERLKIGIVALKKKNKEDVLTTFRTFLSGLDLHLGEEKIHSYVLPYGCFLPSPAFRNVMLIGDAAGFADPLLGEGIFYAQRSAELASEAILEVMRCRKGSENCGNTAAHVYLKLLQKHILTELEYAGKIRHVIFTCLNKFRYLPLKLLMSLMGDKPVEMVHGIRSYKWMKRKKELA
ncbi:MAG: geranylgeranyl reductase family protein [Nitrospiraceae bacterium]|nr:MAG: geranylgeranyl reductase family protein [Nitrospiraceae bacterium]